jgi:hypothetical protein
VAPPDAGLIQLRIPDKFAQVYFNGQEVSSVGATRAYITPESQAGTHMAEMIEKSLLDLDFASLTRRTFAPSPASWEDQVLYFLLDRSPTAKSRAATATATDARRRRHTAVPARGSWARRL